MNIGSWVDLGQRVRGSLRGVLRSGGPLGLLLLGSACAAADQATVRLSWSFDGGSSCAEAGVDEVNVTANAGSQAVASFACVDGFAPHAVTLGGFERGLVLLRAEAASDASPGGFVGEARVEIRSNDVDAEVLLRPSE